LLPLSALLLFLEVNKMAIAEVIFTQVFNKVLERILKPDVPVSDVDANRIASVVTKELAPVLLNQTNSEPLYKSRIMRGLLLAGVGVLGQFLGINITDGDLEQGIHAVTALIEVVGILYAI